MKRPSLSMRKVILYISISLDGDVSNPNGSINWLESIPDPDKMDYGYTDFCKNIDTTIQSLSSYDKLTKGDRNFPFENTKNFVLSNKARTYNKSLFEFIPNNHVEFVKTLKHKYGKDIWLIGGSNLSSALLDSNLIDELHVFVMPKLIPSGAEFFETMSQDYHLDLIDTKTYLTGAVLLKYKISKYAANLNS